MLVIDVIEGPHRGQRLEIARPGLYLVGRGADGETRMDGQKLALSALDRCVPRRGLVLDIDSDRVWALAHPAATNPPQCNGAGFQTIELRDGDDLLVGDTRLRISVTRATTISASTGTCWNCGADLRERADADGRRDELGEDAIYSCTRCLPAGDEHAGRRFGAYLAIRRLGNGGQGDVYLVRHDDTARLLALKTIANIADRGNALRFVDRDRRFIAELRHPALVRYVDSGFSADGTPYLAMQYFPGGSVADLAARNPGDWRELATIVATALDGLAHAHERQVIHRDIKPGNILLDPARLGGPGYARLSDFGLAYNRMDDDGMRLTSRKTVMGTLQFMSPEQAADATSVDTAGDVYAMGCTLYYLLAGVFPFDFRGGMKPSLLDRELNRSLLLDPKVHPVPLRVRRPGIPARLADIVDRAVRRSPGERHASARAMREALLAFLS